VTGDREAVATDLLMASRSLPVVQIAAVVAEGELLPVTTIRSERYTSSYRLKDLEAWLDSGKFIRLGRSVAGALSAGRSGTF
jgi:hypothetical protein